MNKKLHIPNSISETIQFALATFPRGNPIVMVNHFVSHIKDHASQKFQVAIIRAEMAGRHDEAERLLDLFNNLYGKAERHMGNELKMWVIYENPKDHPGKTVARMHTTLSGASDHLIEGSLDELRERFDSQGLVNVGRYQQDDPCIVEVWV